MCMHACLHGSMFPGKTRPEQKREPDFLELELQAVVNCQVWLLRTKFYYLAEASSTSYLKHLSRPLSIFIALNFAFCIKGSTDFIRLS